MVKSTKNLYSLSIVIPAYNEEDSLEWLVRDMIKDAPKFEINDLEIIIVNDGSTDKTYEIADNFSLQPFQSSFDSGTNSHHKRAPIFPNFRECKRF